jgi:predicted ATP-grasp superfamily ATP-dependent carboligase
VPAVQELSPDAHAAQPLIVLGASARAAVFSALRAGITPHAADLFADEDLRRCGPVVQVQDYPHGLEDAAASLPDGPWMYTGGLENHAGLVGRIAARRVLLGNPPEVLRAVRDPIRLAEVFRREGIRCPETSLDPTQVPADGSWLAKPLRGSGGLGIRVWRGPVSASEPMIAVGQVANLPGQDGILPHTAGGLYFQKRIDGRACSAVFVACGGRAATLGATWQWSGTEWTGAHGFQYAGSWGPIREAGLLESFRRIGDILAGEFGLVGLFGVDAMADGENLWPIEVNPRYPASAEVLERALEIDAVRLHVEACREGRLPQGQTDRPSRWCGKAIVYARRDAIVTEEFCRVAEPLWAGQAWPELADVPAAGTRIGTGAPAVTVLADAEDEASLGEELRQKAEAAHRWLTGVP